MPFSTTHKDRLPSHLSYPVGLQTLASELADKGLETVKRMHGLLWLNLAQTQVTDEGAAKLRQALPRCQVSR